MNYDASKITVYELTEKYVRQRRGVRASTRTGYRTVLNYLRTDPFSDTRIDKVRVSDAKMWLVSLQCEKGKSYSAIHSIRGVIRPAFKMAVDDDLLVKNPFDFELAKVLVNDAVSREAISKTDENRFLEFIRKDDYYCKYYEAVVILFNTGLRISEFCGLTVSDVNLKEKPLRVCRQLVRLSNMQYLIEQPKTHSGTRVLPLSRETCDCFETIIERREKPKEEPVVDGVSGFLFLDKNEMPMVALHWEKYFKHIREKHNRTRKDKLPKITPHVCRHTYCTRMAKSGIGLKTLQYLIGHADISITMDTYTHFKYDNALEDLKRSKAI